MALQIAVKSDSKQARGDLAKLNKSVEGIAESTQKAANSLQTTIALIGAGIAAFAAGSVLTRTTDSYKRLEARIALTNKSLLKQEYAFRQINKISIRTRNEQESLADLYSRIGRATKTLGIEQKTVLQVTENVSKAITISGSSAESANSAIVQLGQGLAAGALRGQELNSVMEQTPAVAKAIARGMGITIGQLRSFAEAGKLTAVAVVNALKDQTAAIDEEFKQIAPTFQQAMTVLGLGAGRLIQEFDSVTGSSSRMIRFLLKTGESLNNVARPAARSFRVFIDSAKQIPLFLEPMTRGLAFLGRAVSNIGSQVASFVSGLDVFGKLSEGLSKFGSTGIRILNNVKGIILLTGEAFANLVENLASMKIDFSAVSEFVAESEMLKVVISNLRNFKRTIISVSTEIVGYFARLFGGDSNPLVDHLIIKPDIIGRRMGEAASDIKSKMSDMYTSLANLDIPSTLFDGLIGALQWVEDKTGVLGAVSSMFTSIKDVVKNTFNLIPEEVKPILRALLAMVSPVSAALSFAFDKLSNMSLPKLDTTNVKASLIAAFDSSLEYFQGGTGGILNSLLAGIGKAISFALAGALIAGLLAIPAVMTLALASVGIVLGAVFLPQLDKVLGVFETSTYDVARKVGKIAGALFGAGIVAAFPVLKEAIEGFLTGVLDNFGIVGKTVASIIGAVNDALLGVPSYIASAGLVTFLVFGKKGAAKFFSLMGTTIAWLYGLTGAAATIQAVGFGGAIALWASSLMRFIRVAAMAVFMNGTLLLLSIKSVARAIWFGTIPAIKAMGVALLGLASRAIPAVLVGFTSLMAHPLILAITAAVLAAGALGVFLFGEGDSFSEKLGNTADSIGGTFSNMGDGIEGTFETALDKLDTGVKKAGASIDKTITSMGQTDLDFNIISKAHAGTLPPQTNIPYKPFQGQDNVEPYVIRLDEHTRQLSAAYEDKQNEIVEWATAFTPAAVANAIQVPLNSAPDPFAEFEDYLNNIKFDFEPLGAEGLASFNKDNRKPDVEPGLNGDLVANVDRLLTDMQSKPLVAEEIADLNNALTYDARLSEQMTSVMANFSGDFSDPKALAELTKSFQAIAAGREGAKGSKSSNSKQPSLIAEVSEAAVSNLQSLLSNMGVNLDLSNLSFFTKEQKQMFAKFTGDIKDGITSLAGKTGEVLKKGAAALAQKQAEAIKSSQNVFAQFKSFTFGKGSKEDFSLISKEDLSRIEGSFLSIQALSAEQKQLNVTAERYIAINEEISKEEEKQSTILSLNQKALKELKLTKQEIKDLTDAELLALIAAKDAVDGQLLSYKSISKQLDGLGKIGIQLNLGDFSKVSDKAQADLLAIAARGEHLATVLKQVPGTPEQQLKYDAAVLEMQQLEMAAEKFNEKLAESKTFITDIRDGFNETFQGILKGTNDLGDLFDNLLGTIADRAIGNVGDMVTDTIFGSDDSSLGGMSGFFDGIFGSPEDTLEGAASGLGEASKGIQLGLASNPMFVSVVKGLGGLSTTAKEGVSSILPGATAAGGAEVEDVSDAAAEGIEEGAFSIKGVLDGWLPGFSGMFDNLLGGMGSLFGQLGSALSGLLGGGGSSGGGLFGSLVSGLFSAGLGALSGGGAAAVASPDSFTAMGGMFNDGGLVPGGGQVPIMAHGGEMILNKRQQSNLFGELDRARNGQAGNQQQISINVTGDISRQTKKEIYSMMPTIAQGVNQQNREQNR